MGRPALNFERTHISFDPRALARLDAIVGEKGRAEFIRMALDLALEVAEATQRAAIKTGMTAE